MKRILVSLAVVGSLAAIPVSNALWGKGHVPVHKSQVCHKGNVITVSRSAKGSHLRHGDCGIPACDLANMFQTGGDCSGVGPAGGMGQCTNLPNAQVIVPACVASRM